MTFDAVACAGNAAARIHAGNRMNAVKARGQAAYEYLMLFTSLVIVVFLLLLFFTVGP